MQNGQKVEQKIQDLVNMERPIHDFLGWVLSLDKNGFMSVLDKAGHHSPAYQESKWIEFECNKLAFLWNWTPAFYSFWSA